MLKTKKIIRETLSQLYSTNEAESLTRLIMEHITGYSRLQLHLNQSGILPDSKIMQIREILTRLLAHEPIQYILGETEFYGLKMAVSPGVLIPRAETEELVEWIIREEKVHCKTLLDIGTGSGCIPIALDMHMDLEKIEGWDVSEEALIIARINADKNKSGVQFLLQDIFETSGIPGSAKWDVIVSNPPYVLLEESGLMEKNVVEFEPHLALFVPDSDPLVFYRTIARFATLHLQHHGSLYFEINENHGIQTANLLREFGFNDIMIKKDLQGKERMIRARYLNSVLWI